VASPISPCPPQTDTESNMDVPISLALILAFSVSVWETIHHGPHAYFDACVMLLFFLLIGRFLDARLQRQAHAAAHELAALQNASVSIVDRNGTVRAVPATNVSAGDHILLSPGERAVVDLRIAMGISEIDESLVTGESLPRQTGPGETLFAGAVNLSHPLQGVALGPAEDSLLSEIGRMLEAGEQRRSAYRKIADRAVSLYVPFVHTAAALAALSWWVAGAGMAQAIMIAVTTLIVTCPCALALAAPVAQVVAAGRLFKQGVYLRSGDALERLAEVDYVVFDKTGTLSFGTPELATMVALSRSHPDTPQVPLVIGVDTRDQRLSQAAMLARSSRHPLSRALVNAAGPGPFAEGTSEVPGCGLEADIEGERCRLGSAEWVGIDTKIEAAGPQLWFVAGDSDPVCFQFADRLQDDAVEALNALKARGLEIEILSGDHSAAVAYMANRLGIDRWQSGAKPHDKVARLETLRADGRKVLMVGDGLNDAGALALAHAALAPGGAMDVSQSASDAVYSGGLSSVELIIALARSTRGVMRQNFGLAAVYNLFAVPIAVAGLVTPLIAAIAMSASSLIVTVNALRIRAKG
ncbi:MAG: heavy metal translocating P-type ATPase, partial [Pseudomonadota bacterium]